MAGCTHVNAAWVGICTQERPRHTLQVLRKVDERNFRRFLEEILLHKDLRHPNVVMFRGASWADGRLLMLVDYAGRGTLADVLRRSQGTLKWRLVKLHMALGVAKGMAFLHQTRYYDMWTSSYKRCIVHRDLKPQVRTGISLWMWRCIRWLRLGGRSLQEGLV